MGPVRLLTRPSLVPILDVPPRPSSSFKLQASRTGLQNTNCVFQFVAFPRIVKRFSPRCVFIRRRHPLFFTAYIIFPFENLAVSHVMILAAAEMLIVLQLSAVYFSDMGFGKLPMRH